MRRRIITGIVLLVVGLAVSTSGQNALGILDIPQGVAQIGAGGAGLSVISGAETLYYNPSGLSGLTGISFSSLFSTYMGQASYSAFALAMRSVAIGLQTLSSGGIQGYDGNGNPTEVLSFGNTLISLGFGADSSQLAFLSTLPVRLAIGAQIKLVSARLGEEHGSGFAFDLGTRIAFPDIALGSFAVTEPAVGVTASNLFGSLSYDGGGDEAFAMDIGLGASASMFGVASVALDFHTTGAISFGVAYKPMPTLALRLGVLSKSGFSMTAGVGLDVQGFLIDYAFVSHAIGGTHRIGLTLDFSALDIGALGNSLRRILP